MSCQSAYHLNYRQFKADARFHIATRMLEIAGFPVGSPDFAVLHGQALGEMQERDRAYYLAYLDAQAAFERKKKKKQLESDALKTVTGSKIVKGESD